MDRKVAWAFFGTLFVTISLFIFPYVQTREAPHADGNTIIGYPYTAYSFGGGMCAFDGIDGLGGKRPCPPAWMLLGNIILDVIFLIGLPVVIALVASRVGRVAARRQPK